MSQYHVYLAGAMGGCFVNDVIETREYAKGLLRKAGLTYYDPAEDEGLVPQRNSIISLYYSKVKMLRFVEKDLAAVAESRCILNLTGDRVSDGVTWEMAYATFYRQIPVYCVAPQRAKGELMGFTNILSDKLFKDIESAVRFIKKDLQK